MVQRRHRGAPASGGNNRATSSASERIDLTIPALDPDERSMLREIALRIRGLDARNSVVDRAFQDIAAAVENTADNGPEGSPA